MTPPAAVSQEKGSKVSNQQHCWTKIRSNMQVSGVVDVRIFFVTKSIVQAKPGGITLIAHGNRLLFAVLSSCEGREEGVEKTMRTLRRRRRGQTVGQCHDLHHHLPYRVSPSQAWSQLQYSCSFSYLSINPKTHCPP